MVITYHNDTCFRIASGKICVVLDPTTEKFKADATIYTRSQISKPIKKGEGSIYGGGEYEIGEVSVRGLEVYYDPKSGLADTIYSITLENITIFSLGSIAKAPPVELLERVGNVDILFIPAGKGYLDSKNTVKLVKQIDPSIIVAYPPKQISEFLDEIGQKCETVDKLTLKKKDIIDMGDKTKIVCIKN